MRISDTYRLCLLGYRYGWNSGSERDDEIKGAGNSYTTHYRQLDTRLGRWLSIDPKATAWESPYVSMGNSPIWANDVLGDKIKLRGVSRAEKKNITRELSNQTGLRIKVGLFGNLKYEGRHVTYGKHSQTAQNALVSAIDDKDNTYLLKTGNKEVTSFMVGSRQQQEAGIAGTIYLNTNTINELMSNVSNLKKETVGLGMSIFHELHHARHNSGHAQHNPNANNEVSSGSGITRKIHIKQVKLGIKCYLYCVNKQK